MHEGSRVQSFRIGALILTGRVTLGTLNSLSLIFPICKMEIITVQFTSCYED